MTTNIAQCKRTFLSIHPETRMRTFDVAITLKDDAGRHNFRAREIPGGRVQFEHDYRIFSRGSELMNMREGGGGIVIGGEGWEARFSRMFDLLHALTLFYKEKVADSAWHCTYHYHRCTRIYDGLVELGELEQDPRARLYYQVWACRILHKDPSALPSDHLQAFCNFKVGYKAGWKLDGDFKARLAVMTLLVPDQKTRPCILSRGLSPDMARVLLAFVARGHIRGIPRWSDT